MTERVIEVHDLIRRYGDFIAVNSVSFDVFKGEIFGYLGANGAGKTTTIRILCGLLAPTSGAATVAGIDVFHTPGAVKQAIGYMSQKFSLYPDLTAGENMAFFGGAYGLFGKAFRARRDAVIEDVGLGADIDGITSSLPGGIRQRLALACSILHQPRIVFLDEPTAGVDPEARRNFWRLIRRLADSGTTIFVTTHYMDEAEYCDRIGLMETGRLAALDTPARLKTQFVPGRMLEVHGATASEVRTAAAVLPHAEVQPFGAALHVRVESDGDPAAVLRGELARLGARGATVGETDVTLEDVFLRVVGAAPPAAGATP